MIHFGYSGGWLVGLPLLIGFLILLGIALVPWFFFLLNLQNLLDRVNDRNRAMPAGQVWLNFIPLFNLGWFVYTVVKVRDSVRNEYASRGWPVTGDLGYNVGISAAIVGSARGVDASVESGGAHRDPRGARAPAGSDLQGGNDRDTPRRRRRHRDPGDPPLLNRDPASGRSRTTVAAPE